MTLPIVEQLRCVPEEMEVVSMSRATVIEAADTIEELVEALREIALADRAPDFEPTDEERAKYWSAMAIYQREVARVALAKITSALIVTETVGGSFGSRPLQVVGHSTAGPLYEAPRDGEGVFIASDGTLRVAKIGGDA